MIESAPVAANSERPCPHLSSTPSISLCRYVEDVCNNRAKILSPTEIQITWNTKAADPDAGLIAASQSDKAFGLRRPTREEASQ